MSSLLLFFEFSSHAWERVNHRFFGPERWVLGRLVQSRHDGIFSSGGLLAVVRPETLPSGARADDYQFYAYTHQRPFLASFSYRSQVGAQGILFSGLDRVIPLSPERTFRVLQSFTALLSAFVLTWILLWFLRSFGAWAAWAVFGSMALSPWLIAFGGSLYWCLWAFYLPMVAVTLNLRSGLEMESRRAPVFAAWVFLAVLVKCLFSGFEYITTTLVMMMVPLVFYAVSDRWRTSAILRYGFLAVIASGLAILLTLGILCVQIAAVDGTFLDGARHIRQALAIRTHGNPARFPGAAEGLSAGTFRVVVLYLRGFFLGRVRYAHLIAVFATASIYVHLAARREAQEDRRQRVRALIFTTWFSILAPLSWFIVFKAHALLHPHVDFIVWQMPFTLYGFALCGVASQYAWRGIR